MATILDCPNEILRHIASYLNTRALLSLSRVSHLFHNVSLPFIYKAPILRAWAGYHPPSLPCIIQTLLAKPDLTNHVKSLELELESWSSEPPSRGGNNSGMSSTSVLEYDPRKQHQDIVRLLRMLPRLAYLNLMSPDEPDSGSFMTYFYTMLNNRTMLPVGLQTLREFRCVCNDSFTPELLILVMALPSIRIIAVTLSESCGDDSDSERDSDSDDDDSDAARAKSLFAMATAAAGSSTVTDLQLLDTNIPDRLLAALLTIPRGLTQFRHLSSCAQVYVNSARFLRALVSLAPSLQHLNIDFCPTPTRYYNNRDMPPYEIVSLRNWHALEILECPIMALFGWVSSDGVSLVGMLPTGLRSLHITEDQFWSPERTVELLVELLESREMVSLREIRVKFAGHMESVVQKLILVCEEVNVVFLTPREIYGG